MSAANHAARGLPVRRQNGVVSVELGLVLVVFFLFLFGVIEFARIAYMLNTLSEVTRRAAIQAAVTDFSDAGKVQEIRQNAVFRNSSGPLAFGAPVTDAHVNIEYLALTRTGGKLAMTPISSGALPSTPADNRRTCNLNPNDSCCIRFIRVRICQPGSGAACNRVPYQALTSFIPLQFSLPASTTIMPAGSLGYHAEALPSG